MSPGVHSLDLEKMSLCGTENVSQTGGSIGGASLCNVFDDNEDSVVGPNALMDMTMSIGSHPSSGGRSDQSKGTFSPAGAMGLQPVPLGLNPQTVFGDNASLIAGSTLMDMSVGSGTHSKTGSNRSQNSGSSSGGRSKSGRGSPASMDKSSVEGGNKMDAQMDHQQFVDESRMSPPNAGDATSVMPVYAHHDFKFTWDGKREE